MNTGIRSTFGNAVKSGAARKWLPLLALAGLVAFGAVGCTEYPANRPYYGGNGYYQSSAPGYAYAPGYGYGDPYAGYGGGYGYEGGYGYGGGYYGSPYGSYYPYGGGASVVITSGGNRYGRRGYRRHHRDHDGNWDGRRGVSTGTNRNVPSGVNGSYPGAGGYPRSSGRVQSGQVAVPPSGAMVREGTVPRAQSRPAPRRSSAPAGPNVQEE